MAIQLLPILAGAASAGSFANSIKNFFSGGGGNTAKKQANFQNDVKVNTQHALNFFAPDSGAYQKYLTILSADELNSLEQQVLPKVQADPYFGGLGSNYTSPYVGITFNSVPGVGIAQVVDNYITSKQNSGGSTMIPDRQTNPAQDLAWLTSDLSQSISNTFYEIQAIKNQGQQTQANQEITAQATQKNNILLIVVVIGVVSLAWFILKRR